MASLPTSLYKQDYQPIKNFKKSFNTLHRILLSEENFPFHFPRTIQKLSSWPAKKVKILLHLTALPIQELVTGNNSSNLSSSTSSSSSRQRWSGNASPRDHSPLIAAMLLRVRHKPALHQQACHPPTSRPPTSTTL